MTRAGRTSGEWDVLLSSKEEYRKTEVRVAAAWFVAGTMKGAAELLDLSEQTVKNVLMGARQRAQVETNMDLVQHYWRAIGKLGLFGLSNRKLRYHFDEAYRDRVKKQARDGMRKKRAASSVGLSEHYDRLLVTQGNVCAVCRRAEGARRSADGKPVRLSVDHDHATGAIRELLCSGCNLMLGCAKDDPARLEAGAAYLRKHGITSHNKSGEAA